ncbi:MAG: hypothetical protein HYY17_08610 [Planctomycetes bacterium]|nr:hypothetical protein [Planctomycetota bacterium]
MKPGKEAVFLRLKHSLQALAIPPDEQLGLFPEFVCKADELALDYSHWLECAVGNYPQEFTGEQRHFLENVDGVLESMSGAENAHLWTDDALRYSVEWSNVRVLAEEALKTLGWETEVPPSRGDEFVPGS